jgi:hypothetical protein
VFRDLRHPHVPANVSLCRFSLCRGVCVPAWERSPSAALHASGAERFHAAAAQPDVVPPVRSDVVAAGFRVAQVRPDAGRALDAFRAEAEHFPASVRLQHEAYSPDAQFAGRARYLCADSQAAMEFADAMPPLAGSRLSDSLDDSLHERLDDQRDERLDEPPPSCFHSNAPQKAYCATFPDECCYGLARLGSDSAAPRVKSRVVKSRVANWLVRWLHPKCDFRLRNDSQRLVSETSLAHGRLRLRLSPGRRG